ncbi:MAG: outer membrane beta-barrel protein [Hymenobacteraceae bacterium]|nr:outer membrane beta-barrel protein [Hymenobacteraceae bacterium]MDX5395524.1 outer membrane beta-barrel protein [Hymenobacteraceae bacterium]MDX5442673.1 outer membrane beta-barrel protein [Hymenobacteraceae bacterium]MDX5511578.1 outer membrane beta-barrel protein [Hymenobacteraceae bacterium]
MLKKYFSLFFLILITGSGFGQTLVTGTLTDATTNEPLVGSTVRLISLSDTTRQTGTATDVSGKFQFINVAEGRYRLRTSSVGYKPMQRFINVSGDKVDVGNLQVAQDVSVLQTVDVQGRAIRAEQKGDTSQFNADGYKTRPDADAQDLITKMPGITVENGTVKAQGEDVKKVLVDGKEFFGDDATTALRNLPAEVIDKIQVYDRASDQAQFTGFDDGNSQKTINIITKPGKRNGQFGKVYASYGTDNRYLAGGNINFFQGDRRISVIGLSNNINQQNFASEDLVGALGGSSRRGFGGGGPRGGRGGGGYRGGGNASDFLVGQQNGLTRTHAFGINYSENWGKKLQATGSYFFNSTNNYSNSFLNRTYFAGEGDTSLVYVEDNLAESDNFNHRFNLRVEYAIDSANKLIVTPRLSLQDNNAFSSLLGKNLLETGALLSSTGNNYNSDNVAYNFSNNILFQHQFPKKGRTYSIGLRTDLNNRDGESSLQSLNQFYRDGEDNEVISQRSASETEGYTLAADLSYTEPVGKNGILQINYSPNYNRNNTDKRTNNFNENESAFNLTDSLLSSTFENTYLTNRGGVSYRYRQQKLNFAVGLNYQNAQLNSQQLFPSDYTINRDFNNLLPNAMLNYKLSEQKNLRLMYRTNTNAPSVNQLQDVIDNTNPLLLSTGNPELKQNYTHTLVARYGQSNLEKARNFFGFVYASTTQNYIANSTTIATRDTLLGNGLLLPRGSQLTRPVNLDGYYNLRSFFTYGMPVDLLKSNLNLNTGVGYNQSPGLINGRLNQTDNLNLSSGFVLSSNISEKVDFSVSYNAAYNIVNNKLQPELNNNYFSHNSGARLNWIFWKGFLFDTNLNHTLYSGLNSGFNQSYLLWNMGIGKKLFANERGEIKLSVFDLLNENTNISRNVTETYVEDQRTNVLNRYLMLTFTYNLRHFGSAATK